MVEQVRVRDRNNISTTHVTVVRQGDRILSVVRPESAHDRADWVSESELLEERKSSRLLFRLEAAQHAGLDAGLTRLLQQLGELCLRRAELLARVFRVRHQLVVRRTARVAPVPRARERLLGRRDVRHAPARAAPARR